MYNSANSNHIVRARYAPCEDVVLNGISMVIYPRSLAYVNAEGPNLGVGHSPSDSQTKSKRKVSVIHIMSSLVKAGSESDSRLSTCRQLLFARFCSTPYNSLQKSLKTESKTLFRLFKSRRLLSMSHILIIDPANDFSTSAALRALFGSQSLRTPK